MRRREFIAGLGAAAFPLAARAQQGERMRRIGVLMHTTSDEPEAQARLAAFLQGLQEDGWGVGRNVRIDARWSGSDIARLRKDAADLIRLNPDLHLGRCWPRPSRRYWRPAGKWRSNRGPEHEVARFIAN